MISGQTDPRDREGSWKEEWEAFIHIRQKEANMFGLGFLKLFAVLIDDLLFAEDDEKKRAETVSQEETAMESHDPIKKSPGKAKELGVLFAVLGTLAVTQPDGTVKFYATFPLGGTQMSVLELDSGKTWMIRESGVHGKAGDIIDYDSGEIRHWNYTDGSIRCGGLQHGEE